MALFGNKKRANKNTNSYNDATPPVNADDIWKAPIAKKRKESEGAFIKENKHDDVKFEEVGPEPIDLNELRQRMAMLEREIEERDSRPVKTHADYNTSTVMQDEVDKAQVEYEESYKAKHKEYVDTHKEDIGDLDCSDVEQRVVNMIDKDEARIKAEEHLLGDIEHADLEQINRGLEQLSNPKDVTLDKDYKNIQSVSDSEMSDAGDVIRNEYDNRAESDEYGEIESMSAEAVEKATKEFINQYGNK